MDDHFIFRSVKGRLSSAEEASLQAWRQEAAENERRYRELAAILAAATRADLTADATPPSALKLIHQAVSLESPAAAPVDGRALPGRRRPELWAVAVAAVAAMALLVVAPWGSEPSGPLGVEFEVEEFATGPAEAATVTLRDGTVVRLGPQSRLRLKAGHGRDVALWGRAFFSVARDPERPFRIETAAGSVEVLGTRFEIESRDDDLRVAVVEGRVAVSARGYKTEVPAGEMRRVVSGVTLPAVAIPDVRTIGDWVGDFLAFRDTPLRDAATEIELRYGVQIDITEVGLGGQTITAWFSEQPVEHVMAVVCMVAQAECETNEGDGVITMKPGAHR